MTKAGSVQPPPQLRDFNLQRQRRRLRIIQNGHRRRYGGQQVLATLFLDAFVIQKSGILFALRIATEACIFAAIRWGLKPGIHFHTGNLATARRLFARAVS